MTIDDETIRRAAQGDRASFKVIYDQSVSFVYAVAYRLSSNREDAEEITQDVYLKIFRKLPEFRFRSSLKTWLYRITVNTACSRMRERVSAARKSEALQRHLQQTSGVTASSNGQLSEMNVYLQALNPDQKACFVLREMQGLSYREISETLQVDVNTVRSRLSRARQTLMKRSKEGWA